MVLGDHASLGVVADLEVHEDPNAELVVVAVLDEVEDDNLAAAAEVAGLAGQGQHSPGEILFQLE